MSWTTLLAQVNAPSAPVTPSTVQTVTPQEFELLTEQLKIQQDMAQEFNASMGQLADSFDKFGGALNLQFGWMLAILGILGAISVWVFWSSLKEAKKEVADIVQRRVREEIETTVAGRVEYLERVISQEQVLGRVKVDYVMLSDTMAMPTEYQLLYNRGFKTIRRRKLGDKLQGDVVLLDLVHHGMPEKMEDEAVSQLLEELYQTLPTRVVLVVYVRDRYRALNEVSDQVTYYTPANAPVPLMGAVVNSAYVAESQKVSPRR